jgi:hypothetical protein
MLKIICYLFFISLIITACTDASSTATGNGADSTKKDSATSVKAAIDKDVYNEEQEIKNMIREMTNICEAAITKDTVFIMGNDTLSVTFKHSCTGDSFLLPARYIEAYKIDRFMAHSLRSNIVVKKNGMGILDKRIDKKDYELVLDASLKEYAVLLYPKLTSSGDTIYINYSLSIPLTDVGIAVRASILKDGSIHYGLN